MSSLVEPRTAGWPADPESPSPGVAGASDVVEATVPAPVSPQGAAGAGDEAALAAIVHPLVQDLMLNPTRWRIWSAIAVLRWLQRRAGRAGRRLLYRTEPSLSFAGSEISDVAIRDGHLELILNAPGLATAGSALPSCDIARIIADKRNGGALSAWLDGPADRFMQALEAMQARSNAPFALITGGQVDAHSLLTEIVGRSAPLTAGPGGALFHSWQREPEGALGLAGLFLGPITASGLAAAFRAFTGFPVRVEEFAGAEVLTARPSRVGLPTGMMLGSVCCLPSAGIEVHIEGGSDPSARKWARDPIRRRSLHFLALSYLGAPSPAARIFLWLVPDNAPPAALTGEAALGGLAVLGPAERRVSLPLAM